MIDRVGIEGNIISFRLKPIIKTIILAARQGLALRGHRDDGALQTDANQQTGRAQGNFRELLKFRIDAGDVVLAAHLEDSASNATYISKTTQNLLIKSCGKFIQAELIRDIKEVGNLKIRALHT